MKTCKNCGDTNLVWLTSKAGKFYLGFESGQPHICNAKARMHSIQSVYESEKQTNPNLEFAEVLGLFIDSPIAGISERFANQILDEYKKEMAK